MNGVSGRMGVNQHLIRSVAAIRAQGGVLMSDGSRVMLDPVLVSRTRREGEGAGRAAWRPALDHRPRRRDRKPAQPHLLRHGDDADAPDPAREGHPRRQAHLLREADRHQPRRGAEDLPAGQGEGHQERHGAGQAVPARPAEDQAAARLGLLRPHLRGARRVRLLGVRGRLGPAGAAAVVELPHRGGRRHRARHGLPLALRARQPVRRREVGVVHRRHPHPRARRRGGQDATPRPPTMRPMPPSSSRAASSPTST